MKKLSKKLLALLLVFAMLAGMVSIPTAAADEYNASFIQQLNNLAVDYTSYLDSSKVFKLPEGVSADEEISVIITVDGASVMDAYNGTRQAITQLQLSSLSAKRRLTFSPPLTRRTFPTPQVRNTPQLSQALSLSSRQATSRLPASLSTRA